LKLRRAARNSAKLACRAPEHHPAARLSEAGAARFFLAFLASRTPLHAMASTKRKEQPLHSLVAGAFAGAVEGFATYPTEYVKTQAQFAVAAGKRPPGLLDIVRETLARSGVRGLYSGCS
jgi:hypothetical protein